jgi:hypothetical protein
MPSPIAFIIPALNEEAALTTMLDDLRAALDAACVDADPRNFAQDGAAGWKILWTIAKYGLSSRQ